MVYTCTGFAFAPPPRVPVIRVRCVASVCVCVLSQRDISRASRPTTWFNSHAFLSCSRSLRSRFFFTPPLPPRSPLSPSRLPSSSIFVSLLLPWHGYEGQTRTGEFRAKPWPTKGDVSKSGGSLAILTSPPQVSKYESFDCSELLAGYFP